MKRHFWIVSFFAIFVGILFFANCSPARQFQEHSDGDAEAVTVVQDGLAGDESKGGDGRLSIEKRVGPSESQHVKENVTEREPLRDEGKEGQGESDKKEVFPDEPARLREEKPFVRDERMMADAGPKETLLPEKPPVDKKVFCGQFDDPHELISDRRFRRGFIALDQRTHKPVKAMPTGFCKEKPIWDIAQWDSLGDLSKAQRQKLSDGSVRWSNAYGRVTVGRGARADLSFAVWAYKEYGGRYHTPKPSRVWVHLLAEQRISPPGVKQAGCPPLSSLASLRFRVYAQLLKDNPHYQAGYNKSKHAAQFLIYFTVQNLNPKSPGFGDYLWFGLMPYDDRYPLPGIFVMGDLTGAMGTGKLIYNLGASPFIKVGLKAGGVEKKFEKDILPDIKKALLEAWKRGYLRHSKLLSDYRIGGMNIGWEVPGLNDVEMKVRDLSLRYTKKSTAPRVFEFNRRGDREGWKAVNMRDINGGPTQGKWILQAPGNDPHIISPKLDLDASTHKILSLTFANDHNPASTSKLQVYWERFGEPGFREAWSVSIPVKNNGGWYHLKIDLSKNPAWKGEITRIRIDPVLKGDGHAVGFDRISI